MLERLKVPHRLGQEAWFCELRLKHYGELGNISAGHEEKSPWLRLHERQSRLNVRYVMHPGAFVSSSVPEAQAWDKNRWKLFFKNLAQAPSWDLARFNLLTEDEANAVAQASPWPLARSQHFFWVLKGGCTYQDYLKTRSSSFNRNQGRCLRNMTGQGFTFTDQLDWVGIERVFEARHAQRDESDYSITSNFKIFLQEMRETLIAQNRWWEVGIRDASGTLVAFTIGFTDSDGVWSAYQTGFDPQHRSLRLGALAFEKVIERALTAGCSWITFMGDGGYLGQFALQKFWYDQINIFAPRPKGLLLYAIRRARSFRRPPAPIIEESPT